MAKTSAAQTSPAQKSTAKKSAAAGESTESAADPAGALTDAFMTASRALVGLAVRSLNASSVELTVQQHRVLVILAAEGDQLVGSLADRLAVNASNASRLCDRLQRLGLVARQRSTEDGRAVQVTLTQDGKHALDAVSAMRRAEIDHILERVPRTAAAAMVRALATFNEAANERAEGEWMTSQI